MMLGALNDNLKQSFQAAISSGDLEKLTEVAKAIEQNGFRLSVMEQISAILVLAKKEPILARKMLYCGLFSHAMTMVGLTCLQNFTGTESPFTVPCMEEEFMDAISQNRLADAELIKQCGKWCIRPEHISTIEEFYHKMAPLLAPTYQTLAGPRPFVAQSEVKRENSRKKRYSK